MVLIEFYCSALIKQLSLPTPTAPSGVRNLVAVAECRGIPPPPPPPLQCGRASQSVDHLFAKKRKKSVGENLVSERETLDDEARSILADAAARRGCHASIAVKTPLEWLD